MNRIDRLFGILTLLQSRKFVTAEKIADKFKLSIRTVYRDVKALGEAGIPVSFEPAKGYFIMQGYFLPPVSFSTEEANALIFMEAIAQGFSDKSIRKHYSNALNKVKTVLRASQKEKVEMLSNNIRMQTPACFKYDFEYLTMLQDTISSKTIIELEYKNHNDQQSRRQVEPIGLVFYALSWHLIGWCRLRHEYRDFKVARILHLKNTGMPFQKQDHMELNAYLKLLPVSY
jgi:predicted DNA-binding transcriptional regulator YafY